MAVNPFLLNLSQLETILVQAIAAAVMLLLMHHKADVLLVVTVKSINREVKLIIKTALLSDALRLLNTDEIVVSPVVSPVVSLSNQTMVDGEVQGNRFVL